MRRSNNTWKLRVTGLCAGIHRGPVNSPHKWPVTSKMFPFDDVFMIMLFSKTPTRLAITALPSFCTHYDDVIMTMLASQITSLMVVYSIVYSGVDQSKHQSSASLAFVQEIHRGPVNFPHKWPVTRIMFPFDDVIMKPVQNIRRLGHRIVLCNCTSRYMPHHNSHPDSLHNE